MKSIIVKIRRTRHSLRIKTAALLLLLAAATGLPVAAHGADWVETEGARLRLVLGRVEGDGMRRAMLDIDLKPGWKTYWREPGESGIPPTIALQPTGDADVSFEFPAPVYVPDAYGGFTGYAEPVRLPVILPSDFREADVFLGVCQDVCIPVSASFRIDGDSDPSPLHAAMVDQAFDALPSQPTEQLHIKRMVPSPDGQALTIETAATAAQSSPRLFLAPLSETGYVFGVAKLVEAKDGQAIFSVPILRRPAAADDFPQFSATLAQGDASIRQDIAVE
jgi:DsbC/DsbD-like thiol-disulfide interchange protein